jgi:hypothetical protein
MSAEEALLAATALAEDDQDRIVFLSDLWLDKPDTLDNLRLVLEGAAHKNFRHFSDAANRAVSACQAPQKAVLSVFRRSVAMAPLLDVAMKI